MAASGDALPVVLSGGPRAATFDLVVRGTSIPARQGRHGARTGPGAGWPRGCRRPRPARRPHRRAGDHAAQHRSPQGVLDRPERRWRSRGGPTGRRSAGSSPGSSPSTGCSSARRRPGARRVRLRRLPRRHGPRGRADPARPAAPPRHDPPRPHPARHPVADARPAARWRATAGVGRGHAPARRRRPRRCRRRRARPRGGLGRARPRALHRRRSPPAPRARPLAGLLAGGGVLVLGALALLTDAVSARHGDLAQHLRRGDSA